MENKLPCSVFQPLSSAQTLAHESLSLTVFQLSRVPRTVNYALNKTKSLQNPCLHCQVSQTLGMWVKLRLVEAVLMELEEDQTITKYLSEPNHLKPLLLNEFSQLIPGYQHHVRGNRNICSNMTKKKGHSPVTASKNSSSLFIFKSQPCSEQAYNF